MARIESWQLDLVEYEDPTTDSQTSATQRWTVGHI